MRNFVVFVLTAAAIINLSFGALQLFNKMEPFNSSDYLIVFMLLMSLVAVIRK